MKKQIQHIVGEHWNNRLAALTKILGETTRQIEDILILEDYYRTGHKDESLRKSLGSFGSKILDVESLSSVLQQGDEGRLIKKERYRRVQKLFQELEKLCKSYQDAPPRCQFFDLAQGTEKILGAFEDHIGDVAHAFHLLRVAKLEARAKYEPATHEAFFKKFNWRHLDNAEMELCPPFVVFSSPQDNFGEYAADLLKLVTSGKPLKIFIMRSTLDNGVAETGRAAALKGSTDLELLFISLRNVYFLQGSVASQTPLEDLIGKGLSSPRPSVFSVFTSRTVDDAFQARASRALLARAFPHFVYDPDKASDFVSCLDLSENPALEEVWVKDALEYVSEEGETRQIDRTLTFADFAAGEEALQNQFETLPEEFETDTAIPLAEYLLLKPEERRGKIPFIYTLDEEKHLVRRVPSSSMIAQTADKRHLWHTLQELGGIKNPFVIAAERRTKEKVSAEKERSLNELKQRMESQIAAREQEAVAAAMRNLAARLTGMSVTGPAPQGAVSPAPGAVPAPAVTPAVEAPVVPEEAEEEEAAPVSEFPWIETKLCTTCDECTNINKNIFVYNADKRAVIKDPRGGPYSDIVKAAEKCSSGAIHPGLPQDPNEKDLEKWIKRAEPHQ
jgi:pyruvate-ferredoxin/flavodoxin oxidoreductase